MCVDIYIYIYIYIYVCVCVLDSSLSFKHVWLNNKDTFRLYNLIKILSSFLMCVLVSGWNWRMNLPKMSLALLDKTVLLMNLKNRMSSMEIKYYQEIQNIKALQIVLNAICARISCPVGWGCRIHWLHLYRVGRTLLDMTLNNLL